MSDERDRPSPLQRGRVALASARAGRGVGHEDAPPLPAASGTRPLPKRGEGRETSFPHLSGALEGERHFLPVRVYYEDTDFSGVVYHANYLRFLERGRTDHLRLAGVDQSTLHADGDGLMFAVRRMTLEYLKPARMDDVLVVETRTAEVRGASLLVAQRILRDGEPIFTAEVRVAAIAGGRPVRIPDELRQRLGAGSG